ncbi:MAG: bifunctional phosphopantothenoylcysteine decarboxylase/phosphopantothenate--cysteine ligase CoaBC [Nitrospina sp.]|nr:bifunctional phosphopantothenoylcysteine decarboxylase/phosphopantothenate--cysteine ligase CoaBC [Nitrospina sp.]MBT6601257.1 bifunctional phosphopantothenoylcysteine decarboxylase/phosphopantothenate--cysteine ligase CoaBC [Nitrospina sp.]
MNNVTSFRNKKIILGVSGSIAAYKAVELLRLLVRQDASVHVVMSTNAAKFVTPLTFEALSGNPVYHQVYNTSSTMFMEHIRLVESADLLLVAPATAGIIGKMANGIADDPLSNLFISYKGHIIVAPAMNDDMYANFAVKENIKKMKGRGVVFIEPKEGELACGSIGQGRLAEPLDLMDAVKIKLNLINDCYELRVLVTAGPTQEPLDPVRFITNRSSGKMGYAVADAARDRGAKVTLISGPTNLQVPEGVRLISCRTASEMNDQVLQIVSNYDVLIMSAAVGDFAPKQIEKEKIKKNGDNALTLKLFPTEDVLKNIKARKTRQFIVGFAAESENLIQSALDKLLTKNLDLIVANDISSPGIGFQSDSNQVTFINKDGDIKKLPLLLKTEIANLLLDDIINSI